MSLGTHLPRLTMSRVRFEFIALEAGQIPTSVASSWRGALGAALRRGVCLTSAEDCEGCPFRSSGCPYGRLWSMETDPGEGPRRMREPASPYIIRASPGGVVQRGQRLGFEMRLIGAARAHLAALVRAAHHIDRVGRNGSRLRVRLATVVQIEPDGDGRVLYEPDRGGFAPQADTHPCWFVEPRPLPIKRLRLVLSTPLAIKRKGRILSSFEPLAFTLRLVGRLGALARIHENQRVEWDLEWIRSAAARLEPDSVQLEAKSWTRRSRRSGRVPVEGVVGQLEFTDVPPSLIGLWRCGVDIGVGKNTILGLGSIEMWPVEESPAAGHIR